MKLLRSPFVVGTVDIEDSIKSEDTKSLGVDSAWYGKLVSVVASTLCGWLGLKYSSTSSRPSSNIMMTGSSMAIPLRLRHAAVTLTSTAQASVMVVENIAVVVIVSVTVLVTVLGCCRSWPNFLTAAVEKSTQSSKLRQTISERVILEGILGLEEKLVT